MFSLLRSANALLFVLKSRVAVPTFFLCALCVSAFSSFFLCSSTATIPQTPHSKHSASPEPAARSSPRVSPNPPTSEVQIVPSTSRHIPVRFAPHQFHPTAAARETTPPPARSPPSKLHAAPPATAPYARPPHKPPHHARSPIAPSPKTNVPPPQIPSTTRASSISSYASTQTPASPSLRSRSDDAPPLAAPPAPSHRTPPSHLRSALLLRCTSPRLAATPCQAGSPHQSPANKPKRALAPMPPIRPKTAASFPSSGAATLQSNQR